MKVVVLDDYQDVARSFGPFDRLQSAAGADPIEVEVVTEHLRNEALVQRLSGAEVVVAMRERTPFPAELIERLDRLRLLVTTGMANASIDLEAAERSGVTVCGTASDVGSTVELTWALILGLLRHVAEEDRSVRGGGWQHTVGRMVAGRTLGVVGLGRIGGRVADIGRAFGMRVLAWSQNLEPDVARAHGAEPVTRARLLAESDVVTLHLRLSDRTRGLLGAEELASMASTAYLVNTARGPLVDEQALVAALRDGSIAGAALDVFAREPLPADDPLRSAPNTLLTPHLGYVSHETYRVFYREVVEDIEAWCAGAPVRLLVPRSGHGG